MAQEPESVALFAVDSYGFRPGRSCHDAVEAIRQAVCGYWGRRRDIYIKGTTQVKGAKHAREYHAAVVHVRGVSLYVALDHVVLGQSKEDFLLGTARWLKNLGFKAKWALVDRAYYSYGVLAGMKATGVNVIVPAKN
jgi:hypothetical protein